MSVLQSNALNGSVPLQATTMAFASWALSVKMKSWVFHIFWFSVTNKTLIGVTKINFRYQVTPAIGSRSIQFHSTTQIKSLSLEFVKHETDWIWFVHELVPFQQFQKQTKFICK